jgi:hypothetical protein
VPSLHHINRPIREMLVVGRTYMFLVDQVSGRSGEATMHAGRIGTVRGSGIPEMRCWFDVKASGGPSRSSAGSA